MKKLLCLLAFAMTVCLVACGTEPEEENVGLANPASVYCEDNGGVLEIYEDEEGQVGVCTYDDGSQCEEWDFYNSGVCGDVVVSENLDLDEMEGFVDEEGETAEEDYSVELQ